MDRYQVGILRAYEILKVFGGGSANRLRALLAFLEPEFAQRDGELLDACEFAQSVKNNMKLPLTTDALLDIVPAIVREGWLEPVQSTVDQTEYVIRCHKPPMAAPTSAQVLDRLSRQFSAFLDAREVSQQRFPRDSQYLGECLIEWLLAVDTSDEFVLASEAKRFDNSADQVEFFCARFVDELLREGSADLANLQLISQVGLLSELVREFKKPLNEVRTTDLKVILDSPILMELLGASGDAARRAAEELVRRLRARGTKFHYLELSIDEMQHAIKAMLELPVYERYGPSHAAMQKGEIDEPYVRSIYHNSRQLLAEAGILPLLGELKARSVNPRHVSHELVEDLTRGLDNVYQSQTGSYYRARHDAEAVAVIMRLRAGEFATDDIFKAKFVFLTRNQAFRNTARAFCLRDTPPGTALMTKEEVGPVVDIREMASAIFARMPSEENEDLSRLSLMAACERVLRLNRKVVSKVSILVNKMGLNAGDNVEAMRKVRVAMLHPGSSLYIQDRLRGEDRAISYEDVLREQKRYEQDHINKGIAKNHTHYNQQIAAIEDQLAEKNSEIEEIKTSVKGIEQVVEVQSAKLIDAEGREQKAREELAERERDAKAAEVRRAERIIGHVAGRVRRLRNLVRIGLLALIALVVLAKILVEKIWYKDLNLGLFGYNIEYWVPLTVLFTFLLVLIEGSGGVFGDIKIPVIRRWLARKVVRYRDEDREYSEFSANRFGLTIEEDKFELRIVDPGAAAPALASSEIRLPDGASGEPCEIGAG